MVEVLLQVVLFNQVFNLFDAQHSVQILLELFLLFWSLLLFWCFLAEAFAQVPHIFSSVNKF